MVKYLSVLVLTVLVMSCGPKFIAFEYTSSNMSGEFKLKMTKDSTTYVRTGADGNSRSGATEKVAWKQMNSLAKTINLMTIDTLTAPSNNRAVDQAASAYITFYLKDTVYQSASFDGMNPNVVLKPFTDSLFKVSSGIK